MGIQVKVTGCMRGAPVLELPTMVEDSGSEEEAITPASRKRGFKSGKMCTADTTVL